MAALDPLAILRTYLASEVGMAAKFSGRIYAGENLPTGISPIEDGPCCIFGPRGGGQNYSSTVWTPSIGFRTYAETETAAYAAFQTLYDALNDIQAAQIKYGRMEEGTFPIFLTEPETEWPFVLSYFKLFVNIRS